MIFNSHQNNKFIKIIQTEAIRKIPTIDRSTKPPLISNQQNEVNNIRRSPWKDRTINLDPVYRNVVSYFLINILYLSCRRNLINYIKLKSNQLNKCR